MQTKRKFIASRGQTIGRVYSTNCSHLRDTMLVRQTEEPQQGFAKNGVIPKVNREQQSLPAVLPHEDETPSLLHNTGPKIIPRESGETFISIPQNSLSILLSYESIVLYGYSATIFF